MPSGLCFLRETAFGWRGLSRNLGNSVRLLKIPVVATWCAADLISSDDPLYVGRPGSVASRGANFALQNCDFLLAIGVRLDFAITGYAPEKLARGAHKVAVDIDPAELRKLKPYLQDPVHADAAAFLREFLKRGKSVKTQDRSPGGTSVVRTGKPAIRLSQRSTANPRGL